MFSVFDHPSLKVHHWPKAWISCLEAWVQSLYDRSQSMCTVRNYLSPISHFFADGRYPWEYTPTDVSAFLHRVIHASHTAASGPSTESRNTRLSVISSFYNFAGNYWVDGKPLFEKANPCRGIKRSKRVIKHPTISDQDLEKLFSVIDVSTVRGARDMSILELYLLTGRRRTEVTSLVWGDIECQGGVVYYSYRGKGKGGQRTRTTMPRECFDSICTYLRMSGRLSTIEADDPVFTALGPPSGGLPVDPYRALGDHSAWQVIKKYAQMAGLDPRRVTIHHLRHSNALARLQEGASLQEVSKALGHANVAVTALYIAELSGTEDEGANKLAARFGKLFVAAPAQAMQPCEQEIRSADAAGVDKTPAAINTLDSTMR